MLEIVETKDAPAPIGPYSQAIRAGGLIFLSGQIPIDPATGGLVEGDVSTQTTQVLNNIAAVLAAAGSSVSRVVKTTVFLKNLDDFAKFNQVYAGYFGETRPARSTVQAARLPREVLVEVDAIALA
jgi:2-iminobutanoate/2-iminopropanoate deaminase